jgi:hypothetical protein
MKTFINWGRIIIAVVALALPLAGCSAGGGGGITATGTVSVALTDAPGLEFDHAWITVREIWFHASDVAGTDEAGWLKFPLAAPVTVDLAQLSNGAVSPAIWNNISLPVGNYQQIRIFLASSEDSPTPSATAAGLQFNNQVDSGTSHAPLRVPTPDEGIRLVGAFQVTTAGTLSLVIDFDAGHDIVKAPREGEDEYILKPRLRYFDGNNAGAIKGQIAFANMSGFNFVIKAEQPNSDNSFRVVRRATTIDGQGNFVLYPLDPGNYDILIRGRNAETFIIKGVPAARGTTPAAGATVVSTQPIQMVKGTESAVNVTVRPSGAWVNFYQTLPGGDEIPYEVRFRHLNPYTGRFQEPLPLSLGPLHVGTFSNGGAIAFTDSVIPLEGLGSFKAAGDALMYDRSPYQTVTPATTTVDFGVLTVSAPATPRTISGTITMGNGMMGRLNKGFLLAAHGGMIIDRIDESAVMGSGGQYAMTNLPGGTADRPLSGAFYGLYALGWNSTAPRIAKAFGGVRHIDLRTGDASATISMTGF